MALYGLGWLLGVQVSAGHHLLPLVGLTIVTREVSAPRGLFSYSTLIRWILATADK